MIDRSLMRYIPKQYRNDVARLEKGERVYNEHTKKWNTMIIVEWCCDDVIERHEYQNATYMKNMLEDFGR